MKTSRIFVLAALSLLAAACSKEQQAPEVNGDKITLDLYHENGTKTSVDGNTGKVSWSDGDLVSIKETGLDAENIDAADISIDEDGVLHVTVADFKSESNYVTGFYPYTADNKVSDGSVAAVLPAGQDAKAGTFADFVSPTIGYGQISSVKENGLVMKNICGLIRFKVASAAVSSVKIASNDSKDILAGNYTVTYTGSGDPTIEKTSGSSYITLSGTFDTESSYYIVALPGTLESGITVTVSYNDGTADFVKTGSSALEIKRNGVVSLGTLGSTSSEGTGETTGEWPSDLDFSIAEIYGSVTASDVTAGTATLSTSGAVHVKFNTTVDAVSVAAECETLTSSYNAADGTQWRLAFNFGEVSEETVHTIVVTATAKSNGATKTITLTFTQPAPSKTPVLNVANQTISLGASATSTTISVESAYTTWTAEASAGAELSLTSGGSESASQTETITVTLPENKTSSEVSYQVTITPIASSLSPVTVTITQSAAGDEAEWPSDLNFYFERAYGDCASYDADAKTVTLNSTAGTVHVVFQTTATSISSVAVSSETPGNVVYNAADNPYRIAFAYGTVTAETTYTVTFTATATNGATKTETVTFIQPAA